MVTSSFNRSSPNGSNGFVINGINEPDVSGYSSSEAEELNDDNIIYFRSLTTNSYDQEGLLLSSIVEGDGDTDGTLDFCKSTTNIYDSEGLLLSSVYESDGYQGYLGYTDEGEADGIIDERRSTINTYNSEGLLLSSVEEGDWNADGMIDHLESTMNTALLN